MSRSGRPNQPNAAERFNEERATYTMQGSQPDL
jgi:excinuclease ABC subunit C